MFWNKKKEKKREKPPTFINCPKPKGATYKMVWGKDLSVGDIVVHNYQRCVLTSVSRGRGAGSFDYGEYVSVIANKTTSWSNSREVDFWTYENCPVIVEVDNNEGD